MLQCLYPAMAIAYLAVSYLQVRSGGAQLSRAPPLPAMGLFVVYAACLLFGVYRKHMPYRIAMGAAIPALAYGGVLMNIVNYVQTGLDGYSSFAAWAIGTAINTYGLLWNAVAAAGAYRRQARFRP
jgi:hypothetical protein